MPYIPQMVKNSSLSSTTLNAIAQDIGVNVTVIENNAQTLWDYSKIVLGTTSMTNAFLEQLVNMFAQPELLAAMYENPLKRFKKGVLDYGDGREEVWVEIAKGVRENKDYANPTSPIPTKIPDALVAFHVTNVEAHYQTTVKRIELQKALTSFGGVDYLIDLIISRPKVAWEKDENTLTRLMFALGALDVIKRAKNVETTAVGTDADPTLIACRKAALDFEDLEQDYTIAGNYNSCRRADLTCVLPHGVESTIDVKSLAAAFNLEYKDFLGQRVSIRDFTFKDDEKARILAITDLNAWPIADADQALLDDIQAIVCDKDFLYIFDTVEPHFGEPFRNGADETVNYWFHVAASFGYSPFHNVLVITKPLTRVTVAFNKNNASATGTMADQSIVYNVPTDLKANAYELTGYHFTGWNTAANGSGTGYDDEEVVTLTANTTLYAQWEANA